MKRIPQIDGFRALAILLVITFHYINNQLVNTTSEIGKWFYKLTSFGWVGVDLFFVISGFLIGSILLQNRGSSNLYRTFYIRRFLRIVPNYYLLIFIFLLIKAIPVFKDNYFLTGNDLIPDWSYFLMIHNFYMAAYENMGNDAMSVTWSIGIEEQFYILFPFFITRIREQWLPFFLLLLIALACYFRSQYDHWIPAYVLLSCRMDAIAFGILIAWIHNNYNLEDIIHHHLQKILSGMVVIVAVVAWMYIQYADLGIMRNTLFSLVFACLIIVALGSPNSVFSQLLSVKVLAWIGRISYSLYLFHYMILGICKELGRYLNLTGTFEMIGVSIFALLFSVAFSWTIYTFLEKPLMAVGKKYSYS